MKAKRILIIDDDMQIGNLEQEVLEQHGYLCLRAYSGTEAVMLLEREQPDLIILMSTEQTPVFFAVSKHPATPRKLAKGRAESFGDSARGPTWQSHGQRFLAASQ